MVFLFIGTPEVFFIILIAVLLFGTDNLPEIARGLGEGIRHLKQAAENLKSEILSQVDDDEALRGLKDSVEQAGRQVKDALEETAKPVLKPLEDQTVEVAKRIGETPNSVKRNL